LCCATAGAGAAVALLRNIGGFLPLLGREQVSTKSVDNFVGKPRGAGRDHRIPFAFSQLLKK
jgi:hypothetical protein